MIISIRWISDDDPIVALMKIETCISTKNTPESNFPKTLSILTKSKIEPFKNSHSNSKWTRGFKSIRKSQSILTIQAGPKELIGRVEDFNLKSHDH